MAKANFEGWITKNNVRCSDGVIIRENAFAHCDRKTVPLVYNHDHNTLDNILGYCELENHPEGVYGRAYFNDTESGELAKKIVQHGDVQGLSVYANGLVRRGDNVVKGDIKEVSLVLAGANPGAHITYVDMAHGEEGSNEEAIMTFIDDTDEQVTEEQPESTVTSTVMSVAAAASNVDDDSIAHSDDKSEGGKTVKDLFKSAMSKLTKDESDAVYAVIGMAMNDSENSDEEGEDEMKHNVFNNEEEPNVLSHAAEGAILGDAKKYGSLKESFLAHADEYGIQGIEWLLPEVHVENKTPEFIKRNTDWVDDVFGGATKSPWSRIKSLFADITEDEARAKGYIKGNYKKEEVFTLLKRTTQPCTVYKKQKLDRDDVIDLTDFDAVSWIKTEMRLMLNEEIARAMLIGDGRPASSDEKINEDCIRPIWKDDPFYTIKATLELAQDDTDTTRTKKIIDGIIRSRKFYRGSGNPTFFTTEDFVTDCLLLEDGIGHKLYKSVTELATALRVSKIVTVELMEGLTRNFDGKTLDLVGIIVNMKDYKIGADKGGSVNMFDDFDIDYNQMKYLIETRCSGSLVKPFSAIAVETYVAAG